MAFPTSPTNGQQATVNGIIYTYNSTLAAWAATTTTSGNISGNNITITDQVSSANIAATGTISAAGNITGGNITTVGIANVGSLKTSGVAAVGITTSTSAQLHVQQSSGANLAYFTSTASAQNVRLRVNSSDTTSSVAYVLSYSDASLNKQASVYLTGTGQLAWQLGQTAGAEPTSGTNAMMMEVAGNITVPLSQTISNSLAVGATTPSGTAGQIRATNSITAFYSDKRLKKEICRIENALDKIDKLTGVIYTQNELAEKYGYYDYEAQVGLYTQDVELVQPEAVKPAPFDIAPDGSSKSGENYKTLMYERLVPLLVEGIKELRREIKELKGNQ